MGTLFAAFVGSILLLMSWMILHAQDVDGVIAVIASTSLAIAGLALLGIASILILRHVKRRA